MKLFGYIRNIVISSLFVFSSCSQYDPHVPNSNPFFEGWYSRITSDSETFGFVFGSFPGQSFGSSPSSYVGVLYSRNDQLEAPLQAFEFFPDLSLINITAHGVPVNQDPDFPSPPNFRFNALPVIDYQVNGDEASADLRFPVKSGGYVELAVTTQGPSFPWGPNGEGPEGWAGKLPFLGLHWFVYSLASPVQYKLSLPDGTVRAGQGWMHQEKNWGKVFPTSWIWTEGHDASRNVTFAIAGGPAPVGPITVPNAFLVGYRSSSYIFNSRPQDAPLIDFKPDACNGRLSFSVRNVLAWASYKLVIDISAPTSSFSLLPCPTTKGFVYDSVESYTASAHIQVLSASDNKVLEEVNLQSVALEFGGGFMCGK